MGKKRAAATQALATLAAAGTPHEVLSYEHDPGASSYAGEAVDRLGLDPDSVFKTLVAEADGRLVVAVVPASARLDLKALARATGAKRAAMADPAQAERATGYVTGGISPLGQRTKLMCVVDESCQDLDTLHVSAGKRGLEVALAPTDLIALTGAVVAPVARSDRG